MIIALFALSIAMIVGGIASVIQGFPFVRLESGLAMTIAGATTASAGAVLLGLAVLARQVRTLARSLAATQPGQTGTPLRGTVAMVPPDVPIPALPEPAPDGPHRDRGRFDPTGLDDAVETKKSEDKKSEDKRAEDKGSASRRPLIAGAAGLAAGAAASPGDVSPAWPEPSFERPAFEEPTQPALPSHTDLAAPLEVFPPRNPSLHEASPPDLPEADRNDHPAAAVPNTEPTAPGRAVLTTLAAAEPDLAEADLFVPPDTADLRPAIAEPVQPEPAPPPVVPTLDVVGTYVSGGNTYVMFSDGSIEAETPRGRFTFESLDELKGFVEAGGETDGRGVA